MISSRRHPAVTIMRCELCESMKNVNWTCINCNQRLCNFCKTIHLKSKSSMGHTIRNYDKHSENISVDNKSQSKNIYCNIHPIEALQMYCEDCECPVCYSCATGAHQGHKFVKIAEVIDKTKLELTKCMSKLKKNQILDLKSSLEFLKQNQNEYYTNIESVVFKIENRAKHLKQEIDNTCEKFVKSLQQQAIDFANTINQIENQIQDLQNIMKESKEKFHINNDLDITKFMADTKNKLAKFQSIHPKMDQITFHKKENFQEELQQLFGSLSFDPILNTEIKQKLSVAFNDTPEVSNSRIRLSPRNMRPEFKREVTSTHKVVEIMKSFKLQDEAFSGLHKH